MRKLVAIALLVAASAVPASALAADMPMSPYMAPDYDIGGWYIRGSKEISWDFAPDITNCICGDSTAEGWDWGLGFGIGYEFDNGLRFDKTWDYMSSTGSTPGGTAYTLNSHLLLSNLYVDFGMGGGYDASGGLMAYVGAGAGGAYYALSGDLVASTGFTLAAAAMAGIGYDMGNSVIDFGYRLVYLDEIRTGEPDPLDQGVVNGFFSNQFRVTWRYRFN